MCDILCYKHQIQIYTFNMLHTMRTIKNLSYTVAVFAVMLFMAPSMASAATLSVSPSSQAVRAGDTFTVSVQLDTQGSSIDGVDIRYLSYNPALLQVQDSNASLAGVQITPGNLMPSTLLNNADNSSGRISFSQVAMGGTKYAGSGTLATITFRAVQSGTADLTFSYTARNTTDSNVAAAGTDVLNAVINGSYVIRGGSVVSIPETVPTVPAVTNPTSGAGRNKPISNKPFVGITTDDEGASSSEAYVTSSDEYGPGSFLDILKYIIQRISNGISRIFGTR